MTSQTRTKKLKNNSVSFADHLLELRSRFFMVFVVFLLGSITGYFFHQNILNIIILPLNQPIYFSSPSGGLEFVLQISMFFGFVVSLPFFIFQAIKFIEPIFPKKYPKFISATFFLSIILMCLGMIFAYYISLPSALYFLNRFSTDQIRSLISTKEYFNFVFRYLLGFGIIFQLPLIVIIINTVNKLSLKFFLSKERIVILCSFIFAGILTPTPDIFNQLVMAIPIILLYQITIFILWWVNRKGANHD